MELSFNNSSDRCRVSAHRITLELAGLGEHPIVEVKDGVVFSKFLFERSAAGWAGVEVTTGSDGSLTIRLGHQTFAPTSGHDNGMVTVTDGDRVLLSTDGRVGVLKVAALFGGLVETDTWFSGYVAYRDADVARAREERPVEDSVLY